MIDSKSDIKSLINKLDIIQLNEGIVSDITRNIQGRVSLADNIRRVSLNALKDALMKIEMLEKNEVEETLIPKLLRDTTLELKQAIKAIRELK